MGKGDRDPVEKFLGILFCGGRGERLGLITKYISKAFVPVRDRPVFIYPLARLEESKLLDEIVILTNEENDGKLKETRYRTIVQDDDLVTDMMTGLAFVRGVMGGERHALLMPCDNISDIPVDAAIEKFGECRPDILIHIKRIEDPKKLTEMGVFDPGSGKMAYRPSAPKTDWGVLAPYVVGEGVELSGRTEEIINRNKVEWLVYEGDWFDIGDWESLIRANNYLYKKMSKRNVID